MRKVHATLVFLIMFSSHSNAQDQYIVNGTSYELKIEASGTLTLLWNIIDKQYRYFIKKENTIVELTNTKGGDNKFQEEYKSILNDITNNSFRTEDLRLTLPDLKNFIDIYNASVDSEYEYESSKLEITSRLTLFGGATNHPYVLNPENASLFQIGAELEVLELKNSPRHALFLNLATGFKSNKLDYQLTQFNIGYRFRFINAESLNVFANVTIANYSFIKETSTVIVGEDVFIEETNSENGFDVPLSFGLGADIKVNSNSFITLAWNEIFALLLEDQDNFSTNITLGYKFTL